MGREIMTPSRSVLPLLLASCLLHVGVCLQASIIAIKNGHQQLPSVTATKGRDRLICSQSHCHLPQEWDLWPSGVRCLPVWAPIPEAHGCLS